MLIHCLSLFWGCNSQPKIILATASCSSSTHIEKVERMCMTKTKKNKHFEEFSEAAQVEIYRSASLQLNIFKLE